MTVTDKVPVVGGACAMADATANPTHDTTAKMIRVARRQGERVIWNLKSFRLPGNLTDAE